MCAFLLPGNYLSMYDTVVNRGIITVSEKPVSVNIEVGDVNGNISNRLYNTSNIFFNHADSDAVILGLGNPENDLPLIAVSNGSACTSASVEPSHVLVAMGLDETAAFSSIRFSLGKFNTKKEIDVVVAAVKNVVSTLRSMVS